MVVSMHRTYIPERSRVFENSYPANKPTNVSLLFIVGIKGIEALESCSLPICKINTF
jgi:hypothetical protein